MQRDAAREKAGRLVAQMTLEEAASQLRYDAPGIDRLGIPSYNWWNEGLHGVARAGVATMFPQAIALAAMFDTPLIRRVAEVVATEGRAKYNESVKRGDRDIYKGLTYWTPNVNIFRDPRWGRGQETYGEDPFLTAKLGVAFVRGLQGEGDGVPHMKLAACAKHYAVHSGPEHLRHSFNVDVAPKDLWETYLPAFEACVVEGQVESVMGAYNRVNGAPCCAHPMLMNEILRGKWGFEGHYVSDCWAIRDFNEHHRVTRTLSESAALALQMGCDLNCGCAYQRIMEAYKNGEIDEAHIRVSAIRLFTTRYMLGMFEPTPYDDIPYDVVECEAHLAVSKAAEAESMVLLKNDGILPLDRARIKTLGVIGPNANSRAALIGNYYGTSSRYITVLEGIQNIAGDGVKVLYSEGCHLHNEQSDPLSLPHHRLSEAASVVDYSDAVVLCLGLDESLEGEEGDEGNQYASGDKQGLELPLTQQKLLQLVIDSGKPFIVVLMAGSAMDLNLADAHASAILMAWYPGARGGQTVADILFGLAAPGGKLPVTFYRDLTDMPEFTDYTMTNRTYRFLTRAPLYPFGYGLTYGAAALAGATVQGSYEEAKAGGVVVEAAMTGDASRTVSEVVQVYVRIQGSATEVPNPRLAGFERVTAQPGARAAVRIEIPASAFATVDARGERVHDGIGAELFVGLGQPDARTEALTGRRSIRLTLP